MSITQSFTLSPAVVSRIESFAAEIEDAAQLAGYLWANASSALDRAVLDQVRMALESASAPLLEALGGEQDDERDISPLPHAVPHFLPMALSHVADMFRFGGMIDHIRIFMERDERLAAEYLVLHIEYLSTTAKHLRDTVMEELPSLDDVKKSLPVRFCA